MEKILEQFFLYISDTLENNQYSLKAFILIILCDKRILITFDKMDHLKNY